MSGRHKKESEANEINRNNLFYLGYPKYYQHIFSQPINDIVDILFS